MTWIETIRVTIGSGSRRAVDAALADLSQSDLRDAAGAHCSFFSNPTVSEDVLIVLGWPFEDRQPAASDLALTLVRELRRHGLVSHTVWQPMAPTLSEAQGPAGSGPK